MKTARYILALLAAFAWCGAFAAMRALDAAVAVKATEKFLLAIRDAAAATGTRKTAASWAAFHLGIVCPRCGASSRRED